MTIQHVSIRFKEDFEAADRELSFSSSTARWSTFAALMHPDDGLLDRDVQDALFWPLLSEWWSVMDLIDHDAAYWFIDYYRYLWLLDDLSPEVRASSEQFLALPGDEVTLYRGQNANHGIGLSWTTDPKVALFFAYGFRGIKCPKPVVLEAKVYRSDACMFITDRNESEAVLATIPLDDEITRHRPAVFAASHGLSWKGAAA